MIDDLYLHFEEELSIEIGREPTYEEVDEYMTKRLTITKEEEIEYEMRKIYGHN
jgi:hypothetical protein